MTFNGASVLTTMQNSQDLSPNYTATIFGIINTIGTIPGFLTPMVVVYFTRENVTKFKHFQCDFSYINTIHL